MNIKVKLVVVVVDTSASAHLRAIFRCADVECRRGKVHWGRPTNVAFVWLPWLVSTMVM